MINKFRQWLRGSKYIEKKYFEVAIKERDDLVLSEIELEHKIQLLEAKVIEVQESASRKVKVLETSIGDVEPSDEKKRAAYVASASNFYTDILEKKLMQMVAYTRDELDTIEGKIPYGWSRADYDLVLKGTSNAFKLLMDWGEQMRGEHLSNIKPETNQE